MVASYGQSSTYYPVASKIYTIEDGMFDRCVDIAFQDSLGRLQIIPCATVQASHNVYMYSFDGFRAFMKDIEGVPDTGQWSMVTTDVTSDGVLHGYLLEDSDRRNPSSMYFSYNTCIDLDFEAPTWQEVIDDIDYTNDWFANEGFNVRLQLQGDPNNICDEAWYDFTDFEASDYCDLNTEHGVNGHLNVYYINDGSNAVTFPWDTNVGCRDNMVVLQNNHAGWGWTLAHELGHWFGLYHTFETSNGEESVTRDELDSCFDCEDDGDLLCDTPADYGTDWCDEGSDNCSCSGNTDVDDCGDMSGSVDNGQEDSCNDQYDDDILLNIMAYGCRPCAHDFSQGQVDRMWMYATARLLQSSIKHTDCADDYTFSGTRTSNGVRAEAHIKVTSSEYIKTEQYVLYDGDSRVILNEGFRAEPYSSGGETRYPNVEMRTEGCWGNYQFVRPSGEIIPFAEAEEELRAIAKSD